MAFSVTKCDVGGSTASGYHYEYLCESADDIADLPTGASSTEISRPAPGSLAYIESDSSARYILKNSREWGEYPMAGGGGSTGGGVFIVTATFDEEAGTLTLDKTWLEIATAMSAGKIALLLDVGDLSDYGAVYSTIATAAEQGDNYANITFIRATIDGPGSTTYTCSGPDEYPVFAT